MQIVDEIGIVLVAVLQVLVILVLFDIEFVTEKRVERPDDQYALVRFHDLEFVCRHKFSTQNAVILRG